MIRVHNNHWRLIDTMRYFDNSSSWVFLTHLQPDLACDNVLNLPEHLESDFHRWKTVHADVNLFTNRANQVHSVGHWFYRLTRSAVID